MKPISLVALLDQKSDLADLRDSGFFAWRGRSWVLAIVDGILLGDALVPPGTQVLLLNGWEEGGLGRETRVVTGAGGRRLAPFYIASRRPPGGAQARFAAPGSILSVTVDAGSVVTLELHQLVRSEDHARLDVTEIWSGSGNLPRPLRYLAAPVRAALAKANCPSCRHIHYAYQPAWAGATPIPDLLEEDYEPKYDIADQSPSGDGLPGGLLAARGA